MSFDMSVVRYVSDGSPPISVEAFDAAFRPYMAGGEDDDGYWFFETPDHDVAAGFVMRDETGITSVEINKFSGGLVMDLIFEFLRRADAVLEMPGCPTALIRVDQWADLPDGFNDAILVRSGRDIDDAQCVMSPRRPVLFLDVDGTLLPQGGDVERPTTADAWQDSTSPLLDRLTGAHGPRLLSLPTDMMWADAWLADANEVIAPLLRLSELPVVDLGELPAVDLPSGDEATAAADLNPKTRALVDVAAGRTFVWIDDDITDADRAWVTAHHPGRALLHTVESHRGLTTADADVVDEWLRAQYPL